MNKKQCEIYGKISNDVLLKNIICSKINDIVIKIIIQLYNKIKNK